ncbi:tyrosine-protein phosphatase [Patulibacter minatonensis]|uniref:tyrosine-protein phosphatase n=1 Tax=Patulibacter minatonensis TaxID=298163 RepID=UPI0006863F9F|nr:CpsB/CapC family capsule biosynthesis tyrosine phosphatase [Patulibacter minatonensis]
MIDLHCHILPGIDDGPDDLEGSLAMAREHVARGTSVVVATPHVGWDYPNTPEVIVTGVATVNRALQAEGIPLEVLPGAEVALTRAVDMSAEQLAALRLGGGPWLLLEAPISVDSPGIEGLVGLVQSRGVRVLLAHPERCASFHTDPELLSRLVAAGCLAQVTAGALTGFFGRTVEAAARRYLDAGLVHVVASDAHDATHRAPGMAEPMEAAGYAPLAPWMATHVPRALLEGVPVPPRPPFIAEKPKKKRFWR